jgi:hypothetical protein
MVAAGDPVEREGDLLLREGARRTKRKSCPDRQCEF